MKIQKFSIKIVLLLLAIYFICGVLGLIVGYFWLLLHYTMWTAICTGIFVIYIAFEDKFNPHVKAYYPDYD